MGWSAGCFTRRSFISIKIDLPLRHVHFIGIGGAGMSGLAEVLLMRGIAVSGSDASRNKKTDELTSLGATISIGHDAKNLDNADSVVYSSAIDPNNVERVEAERRGIRLVRRADFLGEILRDHITIAIAGTHGKTTVTSMIASVLIEAGLDPLVLVGASVRELGGKNSRAGAGKIAVIEADEYDRSFLALGGSYIAVMTSLEAEHLDTYGDVEHLKDAFVQFANQGPSSGNHPSGIDALKNGHQASQNGFVIVSIDDPMLREITPRLSKRIVTYGIDSLETKYRASDLSHTAQKMRATLVRSGETAGEIELRVPGKHNVLNALAAIATADVLSIPLDITLRALKRFGGAERRFDVIGEANGVIVIDDYAHHPTEVRATLTTARQIYPGRRIVACFQPHTYTRTRDFAEGFGQAFADSADVLLLLDIYPAREAPIADVTSDLIKEAAARAGMQEIYSTTGPNKLPSVLADMLREGDVVLTIGAGTITEAAPVILHDRAELQALESLAEQES
jgi:UDP-N-acetylmuramate--alanine ligase